MQKIDVVALVLLVFRLVVASSSLDLLACDSIVPVAQVIKLDELPARAPSSSLSDDDDDATATLSLVGLHSQCVVSFIELSDYERGNAAGA